MLTTIFFDIDNTLLDYAAARAAALRDTFALYHLPFDEATIERFDGIDSRLWALCDMKLMPWQTVEVERFARLLVSISTGVDAAEFNAAYKRLILDQTQMMPHADIALQSLHSAGYRIILASNNDLDVQQHKIELAGLSPYVDAILCADQIGLQKTDDGYMERCLDAVDAKADESMMVGDSLRNDVASARRASITTCWYNPLHLPQQPDLMPDFEIHDLRQVLPICESLKSK